jgi:GntR family transcriptional repressor for pyruvate dehydrogenase complex
MYDRHSTSFALMPRLHRGPLQILIAEVVNGEILPGEALPREADLAERFEISRSTAREVTRGLEARGLIAVKHGRGATVNDTARWDTLDADVLAALLRGPRGSQTLEEFLEARRVLEIEAAGMAAERADGRDIARLSAALEKLRAVAERAHRNPAVERQYHEADVAFHCVLAEATKNSTIVGLTARIHAATLEAGFPPARPMLRGARTLPEYERIARAVASGSAAAARNAMKEHLDSVREFLGRRPAGQGVAATGGSGPSCSTHASAHAWTRFAVR